MKTNEAKKIIKAALEAVGLSNRLTAKTVDFAGFGWDTCIFVCVHDWKPSPIADEIKRAAKASGFCVEFAGNFATSA